MTNKKILKQNNRDTEFLKLLQQIENNHQRALDKALKYIKLKGKSFDSLMAAATISGLTTYPELQSNAIRLDALIYYLLRFCKGKNNPTYDFLNNCFSELKSTKHAHDEDPAENVFISTVSNENGQFLLFEGLWEANAFYTQRFLDVLLAMPNVEEYKNLKNSVFSLLKISNAIVSKCKLQKYKLGNEIPENNIPVKFRDKLTESRNRIKLNQSELLNLDIKHEYLLPFLTDIKSIVKADNSSDILSQKPIIHIKKTYYVLLPSAIGVAIRRYIIEKMFKLNQVQQFEYFLMKAYGIHFYSMPLLGTLSRIPIKFENTKNQIFLAETIAKIDLGRFVQFLFVFDNMEGCTDNWFLGVNKNQDELGIEIQRRIKNSQKSLKNNKQFKSAVSLIVLCGWGRRSIGLEMKNLACNDWFIEYISSFDLTVLSHSDEFKPLDLWRLIVSKHKLEEHGTEIKNASGLLNLYALAKSLDFHLIPHNQFQDVPYYEKSGLIIIPTNSLRDARYEYYLSFDEHQKVNPDHNLIRVQKSLGNSFFKEEKRLPLYVSVTGYQLKPRHF